MKDGSFIMTVAQWWIQHRPKVLKDVQERIYPTGVSVTPVYRLLEALGLVMPDAKPHGEIGYISGEIAYRYRNGGHTDAPDWPAFFQFAARYVKR